MSLLPGCTASLLPTRRIPTPCYSIILLPAALHPCFPYTASCFLPHCISAPCHTVSLLLATASAPCLFPVPCSPGFLAVLSVYSWYLISTYSSLETGWMGAELRDPSSFRLDLIPALEKGGFLLNERLVAPIHPRVGVSPVSKA